LGRLTLPRLIDSRESSEALVQPLAIRQPRLPYGHSDRLLVKLLEELKHRTVLVVEQSARDAHFIVGRDTDEIVIESPVVDRAETQTVAYRRLTLHFQVADDMRSV
jgi:hypothetical protein